jgi:hypothetical protein
MTKSDSLFRQLYIYPELDNPEVREHAEHSIMHEMVQEALSQGAWLSKPSFAWVRTAAGSTTPFGRELSCRAVAVLIHEGEAEA